MNEVFVVYQKTKPIGELEYTEFIGAYDSQKKGDDAIADVIASINNKMCYDFIVDGEWINPELIEDKYEIIWKGHNGRVRNVRYKWFNECEGKDYFTSFQLYRYKVC